MAENRDPNTSQNSQSSQSNSSLANVPTFANQNQLSQANNEKYLLVKSPGPYIPGTSWRIWQRKFTNFCTLRRINEDTDKLLIFLQEVGDDNYALLEGRMNGKPLEECTLKELTAAMESHFQPKHLAVSERFKLLNHTQKQGQSLTEFYAALQMNAKACSFEKVKDIKQAFMVMAFVGGIRSDEIRRRLLEKEDEFTPEQALETAEAYERVLKNTKNLNKPENASEMNSQIAYVQKRQSAKNFHGPRSRSTSRFAQRKNFSNTPYFEKDRSKKPDFRERSHNGPKKGYYNKSQAYNGKQNWTRQNSQNYKHNANRGFAPRNEMNKFKRRVGFVEYEGNKNQEYDSDGSHHSNRMQRTRTGNNSTDEDCLNVDDKDQIKVLTDEEKKKEKVRYYNIYPRPNLQVFVNGKKTQFELDTGAVMSIIGSHTWQRLGGPKLTKVKYEAAAFNGQSVPIKGVFEAKISLNEVHNKIYLHVVDGHVASLCGRDMLVALKVDCGPYFPVNELSQHEKFQENSLSAEEDDEGKVHKSENPVHRADDMNMMEIRNELTEILKENQEVFNADLGKCTTKKATLKFKGPIESKFHRARPVPHALKPKVDTAIDEMVKKGIWEKVNYPKEFVTPLVIVPKPNGSVRICGDFKVTVNPCLDIDQHPLPRPDDVFHAMVGGKKFSKMDLSEAYMQVEMDDKSKDYLMVNTHKGLYRYNRLPFGIASAPAIFQEIMDNVLAGMDGVLVYLDDIIITAKTDKEHLQRVKEVLQRLKRAGLRVKRDKCSFMQKKLEFLGHILTSEGIQTSPKKLEAIVNMPEPKNLKEVVSFLSMVQYYGKFIPQLATIAAPLNHLRKQGVPFEMTPERQKAVQEIKKRLTQTDILTHFNPDIPVILATDASDYGIGAVIYHKLNDGTEKVIAYASRTLTQTERNYAQIEKEALGIVYGVEKFNQFLYGRKFTLLTDHQPLTKIFGPKTGLPIIAARRLHRWALRLMAYSFDIEYRNTHEFGNADGLSRLPNPKELTSVNLIHSGNNVYKIDDENIRTLGLNEEDVRLATANDETLSKVGKFIQSGWPRNNDDSEMKLYFIKRTELSTHKGIILWHNRVVIPQPLQKKALQILHRNHYGRNRMIALARSKIWFPGIDRMITEIAESCPTCAIYGKNPPKAPLHPWETPEKVWQRIHIDFCETSPNDKYLVIVDAKSKWPEVIYMRNVTTTSKTIQKLNELFATHGIPEQIVSDNGPQFASKEFANYCKEMNMQQTLTAPYHPNSNGEAERFVQTFKDHLYKSIKEGTSREKATIELLFHYRATNHPAIGMSPAEMLMGRKIRTELDIINETKKVCSVKYNDTMKRNHDKISKFREFHVGDMIYVMNFSQIGDKWIPGIITHKHGQNLYDVQTIIGSKKAHINQIKRRKVFTFWEDMSDAKILEREREKLTQTQQNLNKSPKIPRRSTRVSKPPVRYNPMDYQKQFGKRANISRITEIPMKRRTPKKNRNTRLEEENSFHACYPIEKRKPAVRFKSIVHAKSFNKKQRSWNISETPEQIMIMKSY